MSAPTVLLLDMGRTLRGGQKQVLYLAEALLTSEFSPLLACPHGPLLEAAQARGIPVQPIPARLWHPELWLTLRRLVALPDMAIVHTHDAHAATAGAVLRRFCPRLRLIHSRRVSYALNPGARQWKYRQADAVVGVSADITAGMARAGLPKERLYTIHSGIDPSLYTPQQASLTGENTPFVFLAVGALTPQKGFAVLLEAAALLKAENLHPKFPWQVRLVGDGPLRDALLAQRERLGLTDLVNLPGRRDSINELSLAHALVVPSVDGEGSSGVIKEGWATGLPVIASDLAANHELVLPETSGLLAATGNAQALACAMHRVLIDPALRQRIAAGGAAALPNFTAERMAQGTLKLYRTLLCSSPTNLY